MRTMVESSDHSAKVGLQSDEGYICGRTTEACKGSVQHKGCVPLCL